MTIAYRQGGMEKHKDTESSPFFKVICCQSLVFSRELEEETDWREKTGPIWTKHRLLTITRRPQREDLLTQRRILFNIQSIFLHHKSMDLFW